MKSKVLINAQNISLETESGTILNGVTVSISESERIGLVGPNGSGKTTLMKVMGRIAKPSKGEVFSSCSTYYVPQLDLPLFKSNISISDYLSKATDEWWNITSILETKFDIHDLDIQQSLSTLSGGELMKLHLAVAFALNPDVLFLDEPTNHLDLSSVDTLIQFLKGYKGSYVIISHDPFFLDQVVDTIWEIEGKKINKFGGNYSEYREQKAALLAGKERQHEAAQKELRVIKRSVQLENKRAARSKQVGKDIKFDRSMPAIQKGFFANKASLSAAKTKDRLSKSRDEIIEKVKATQIKKRKRAYVELGTNSASKGRTLIRADHYCVMLNDGRYLINDAEFEISYGDRIVITGKNGVGKTLFVKALLGDSSDIITTGEVYLAPDSKIVYLSQKYEIVNPELTLAENLHKINPDSDYEKTRRILANFLFLNEEEIKKKAKVLSGGEIARLAFAMITSTPVDLLVLDEPTNNLDIETIDAVVEALKSFKGAIIVISHNIDFLSKIGIEYAYVINNKYLKKLGTVPKDKTAFFLELSKELK